MQYDKHEYRAFCRGQLWGAFHLRNLYGEGFYVLITNNISKEVKK